MAEQFSTTRISILFAAVISVLFSSLLFAQENLSVHINSSSVSQIIAVSNPKLPDRILPFYEYQSDISVNWAIPYSSLDNIVSDEVKVYVKAVISDPGGSDGSVYFKEGSRKLNISYVVLTCHIMDSGCSQESELQRNITLFVYMDGSQNLSATVSFFASLSPFEEFVPIYAESILLQQELDEFASTLNLSDSHLNESVAGLIDSTQEHLSSFHLETVKSDIKELGMLTGKGDISLQINLALNGLLFSLQSVLGAISSDILYALAFSLALIVLISIFFFKIRKGERVGMLLVSIGLMVLSVLKPISAEYLIMAEFLLLLLLMSVLFVRKPSDKRSFRSKDKYLEGDSEYLSPSGKKE